jgi:hypothetical protein
MPSKQNCPHCGKVLPTAQGLKAHITHTPTCCAFKAQAHNQVASTSISAQTLHPSPCKPTSVSLLHPATLPPIPSSPTPSPLPLVPPVDSPRLPKRPQPTIKEVPDKGDSAYQPHSYLGLTFAEFFPIQVATTYNQVRNPFKKRHQQQEKDDLSPFTPFVDHEEWELASLLMKSEISQTAVNDLLHLDIVCSLYTL